MMEALQDRADQSGDDRKAMEERLLEEFAKNERAQRLQGVQLESLKLFMGKHQLAAEKGADRRARSVQLAMDTIMTEISAAGKRDQTNFNAVLKNQKDAKNDMKDVKDALRKRGELDDARRHIERANSCLLYTSPSPRDRG